MRKTLLSILWFAILLTICGCATTTQGNTDKVKPGTYVMVVRRTAGKNVIIFPNGEPDSNLRKYAQEFADDLLNLKEGEQKTITINGPKN